jgi:hypothetical protein
MTTKIIFPILFGLGIIIGWNVFLAQRDQKLYDAYDQLTLKEQHCEQLKVWHPDCKVE